MNTYNILSRKLIKKNAYFNLISLHKMSFAKNQMYLVKAKVNECSCFVIYQTTA